MAIGMGPSWSDAARGPALELIAQPRADHRDRAAVFVVGRIPHELVIDGGAAAEQWEGVIHLQNLLRGVMGQLAISDEYAETTRIEIGQVLTRDAIDDGTRAKCVVGASPGPPVNN